MRQDEGERRKERDGAGTREEGTGKKEEGPERRTQRGGSKKEGSLKAPEVNETQKAQEAPETYKTSKDYLQCWIRNKDWCRE